ncbi:MAG TPA: hypothetical protein VMV92_09950 [Streptosporangiaceae bacterium]|nr:hypothetical protein [Streptosporangiaceae bacterium]
MIVGVSAAVASAQPVQRLEVGGLDLLLAPTTLNHAIRLIDFADLVWEAEGILGAVPANHATALDDRLKNCTTSHPMILITVPSRASS